MITRRRALAAIAGFAIAVAAHAPNSAGAESLDEGAKTFIRDLAQQAVKALTDGNVPRPERIKRFRDMFNEHFAVRAIGKWILGRHWRKATEDEQAEYLRLFEDLMVVSYVDRFAVYAGDALKINRAIVHNEKTAIVFSEIIQPGSSSRIRVDWRVGRNSTQFKILDVMVEGTSMSQTLRSDFGSTIRNRGGTVAGLLDALREKTAELKKEEG